MSRTTIIGAGMLAMGAIDVLSVVVPMHGRFGAASPYIAARLLVAATVGAVLIRTGTVPRALLTAGAVSVVPAVCVWAVIIATGHAGASGPAVILVFLIASLVGGISGGALGILTVWPRRSAPPSV